MLLVVSDLAAHDETERVIELANALVREHAVFLCNARPNLVDDATKHRLSPRLIFVEGTIGPNPWSLADERIADEKPRRRARCATVLGELAHLLRIDVVHSHLAAADRLVLASRTEPLIPCVFHARSVLHSFNDSAPDPDARRVGSLILNEARGFFYEDAAELDRLEKLAPEALAGKPRWILDRGRPAGELAACCGEAYLEVRNVIAFALAHPGESTKASASSALRKPA